MKIFDLFRKKAQPVEIERLFIHTDSVGNKWYAYADPLQMRISRKLELEDAEGFLTMNLTRKWLQEHNKLMIECLNSGQIVNAVIHQNELQVRLEMNWSRMALIHFCISYYLIENEPDEPSASYYQMKRDLVLNDYALQDFFLDDIFKRYKHFTENLRQDFLTYSLKTAGLDKSTFNHSLSQSFKNEMSSTKHA